MMNFTGKVNRTFAVQGIPAGRVGAAEKLGLQADLPGRRRHRQTDYGSRRLPGCPTGCATDDTNTGNEPAVHLHLKFRGSEQLAIGTQTLLPGQTTSGGRADQGGAAMLFTRGDNGNVPLRAAAGQVSGEIGMGEKIKHQISFYLSGEIGFGIINDRRQFVID
jgi:hypothetical protein